MALPVGQGIEPPPLWFGGSSDKAIEVAAKHVETYLSWGETPDQIGAKVDLVKARAEKLGRELEYGIRLYVIVRDTDEEAWAAAAVFTGAWTSVPLQPTSVSSARPIPSASSA